MQPGDFIFVESRSIYGKLVSFGQRFRFRGDRRKYARWNHVALVVDRNGYIAEAISDGVIKSHIDTRYHKSQYLVVNMDINDEDRDQIVDYAESVLEARTTYDWLMIVCLAVSFITGSKIVLGKKGSAICSGFVSEALTRAGEVFDRPPSYMSPADLAEHFDIALDFE
jgi:uncharacterized protein YycO